MRKLFLLVALLLLVGQPVFAETTATFGDMNSSNEYRMKATYDGTSGVITFASDTGILYPYENYTSANTANTVIAAESGKVITDTGGAAGPTASGMGSKHTLPTAAPGMVYTFIVGTKSTVTVDVQSGDTIQYSISGTGLDAGDSIKSTGQAGDAVTLFCTVANKWSIKDMKAVWTDNGTS